MPAIDLSRRPIHLHAPQDGNVNAEVLENFNFDGPSFDTYLERYCSASDPGRLVMVETTPEDWGTWERHTAGDELVIVLAGEGEFIQQIDAEENRIPISPGTTILNPTGVWHTADVRVPLKAVYITPCQGTEHKPRN